MTFVLVADNVLLNFCNGISNPKFSFFWNRQKRLYPT